MSDLTLEDMQRMMAALPKPSEGRSFYARISDFPLSVSSNDGGLAEPSEEDGEANRV